MILIFVTGPLVFVNELNKAYPVRHIICNQQNELVLTPFFKPLKNTAPKEKLYQTLKVILDKQSRERFGYYVS